jgi:hypothetical protein
MEIAGILKFRTCRLFTSFFPSDCLYLFTIFLTKNCWRCISLLIEGVKGIKLYKANKREKDRKKCKENKDNKFHGAPPPLD